MLLSHKKPDGHINVKVEFGEVRAKFRLILLKEQKTQAQRASDLQNDKGT